ncbi:unnamed protein product, partial [Mesorhabditis belari]|uniref:Serpentine Receptor, class H n=1 Tax=Mesorhabditis belari TaxID=2138241 RepID=A0AAF3FRT5_9BILA
MIELHPTFEYLSVIPDIYVSSFRPLYPPYVNMTSLAFLVVGIAFALICTLIFSASHVSSCMHAIIGFHASERTQRLQRKFFLSLCIQEMIPVVAMTVPWTYFAMLMALQSNYINQWLNNLLFSLLTTHGSVSCISLLFLTEPYKRFVFSLLKKIPGLKTIQTAPLPQESTLGSKSTVAISQN